MLQENWEDDPSYGAAAEDEANSEGASAAEPVAHDRHRWIEPAKSMTKTIGIVGERAGRAHKGDSDSKKDSLGEEKLICLVFLGERDHHHCDDAENGA